MGKAVLYMSMSVDGFIAGPRDGPGNELGDGGHRLHEWFLIDADAGRQLAGASRDVMDEAMSTGAVVVGRRTFELAGGWDGDHHDGVPIVVLSRHPPDPAMQWPAVTYVPDVAAAVHAAKDAAGCKGLRVGTASVSPKHANFIQADEGGSADDVFGLMGEVRQRVLDHSGVELHHETVLVGFGADVGAPKP